MPVVRIVNDAQAATALLESSGRLVRHAFAMALDLAQIGPRLPVVNGFTIAPMSVDRALEYGAVVSAAYPPQHLDHEPADTDPTTAAASILEVMSGAEMGPLLAHASFHVTNEADHVVGQIVVNDRELGAVVGAGPFVTDICVAPEWAGRGLGAALLRAASERLADDGWTTLALVVSVGNPAQRVYEKLGFCGTAEFWRIETPS